MGCRDVTPTIDRILGDGSVDCNCDTTPEISNIHPVGDHREYTITGRPSQYQICVRKTNYRIKKRLFAI